MKNVVVLLLPLALAWMKAAYLPLPLRKTCSESWDPPLSKGEELEKQVELAPSKSKHALAKREGTSGLARGEREWRRRSLMVVED